VSPTMMYFFAIANVVLLAFVLLAVRRSVFRLKTEVKRNLALREQSERYREMFEKTETGVFRSDIDGHFKYINQAGVKILGFDRARELYDRNITPLQFYANSQDDVRVRSMLRQGISIQNQYFRIINAKGETLYIEGNVREIRDDAGNPTGFDGFFRDVTQRVTAQEALWSYSNNLERMVREKTAEILALERGKMDLGKRAALGEIASALVHELRDPLSSMKMAFLTIKNRFEFEEPIVRIIEDACTAGLNMERILNDVLDFARPRELCLIRQDLRPIVDLAGDSFDGEMKRPGIVFRRESAPGILMALVDSARLGQAVRNLIQNAADALPDGHGEITLKTEFLRDEDVLRITVSDNGAGIAGEDQGRVFEPFFTRKDGGTGLGLTLVKKITEAHHGRAAVESTPGRGTSVRIELPAERR
jgi:PAS domain S-box-containing protein